MATHTPGPWELSELPDGAGRRRIDRDGFALAIVCARASFPGGPEYLEKDANAHLIAAAPELLAACKELREAICGAMRVIADLDAMKMLGAESETRQQRFVDEMHAIGLKDGFGARAEAVIAKAEGRS